MNSVTVSNYPARVTLHCGQNKVTLRYAQKGERGIGISNVALDDQAHLIVTYDDGKTQDAGAALGDVASVKDGIDSSYKKVQTSEANVTKLEASTKANADKAQQALQDTQSASTSGVDTINTMVSEKMTYMTSTFNFLLTQAKANIDQFERDAEDKLHSVRTYSLEQIKTAHGDAMVDIEHSVNKAEAWAVSETTPDKEPDFESPTGLTQSSRSWALLSKKKVQEAFDTLKDIKDNETNVSNMKNDVAELLRKTQDSEQNTHNYMNDASASQNAAKESENTAETYMENAKTSEVNAKASETASADSASKAHTSEMNAKTSETSAATSASNAKASETNAKTSETNAAMSQQSATSSETVAKNWAIATISPDGATDADSNTGKTQSSRSWALASKASAESASSSASIAATQASYATASANSASESATSASDSATSASSSATAASNSASAAATSATNASNSETRASGYKTAASDSATAAAASATSASTSATNAKASMNTANTAESSASTSATSASTSASNASKSEIAAKTAQAEAEKARDDANSAVNKLTGAMKYAGQVDNYSDLESYTKNKGDVWNIVNADPAHGIKAGDNVAWNGTDWDNLSGTVDLSIYAEKSDYQKTITSATADGATITFNHKDGTTSTAMVNNVASATAATNDAKGQRIDTTYEKVTDASNVHTSLQNSINSLSTSKQDKLTFDSTPTANSTNLVTSDGIKAALDGKPSNTGDGASGTWGINITGNANTATNAGALSSWGYRPTTANNTFADTLVRCYLASSSMSTGKPPEDGVILHFPWDNAYWDTQLFISTDNSTVAVRAQRGSPNWSNSTGWKKLALADDVPVKNGTGASGTWDIDISGTADNATNAETIKPESFFATDIGEYMLIGTLTAGQVGTAFGIKIQSSNYFNNGIENTSREASLYFRTSNGVGKTYSAYAEYHRYGNSGIRFYIHQTSNLTYDIYLGKLTWSGHTICIPILSTSCSFEKKYAHVTTLPEGAEEVNSYQLAYTDTVNNYAPTKKGTGASGTWGIDITGTATKATQDGNGANIAETYLKKSGDTVTGTLNVPTQATTDNSTKVANTAFVQSAVSQLVNSAPETLDTLNELSNALGDDPNFATTVTNMIGQKADKTGTGASGTWNIGISGNAATATKAEQDASGNNIANTYAKKTDTYTKTEVDTAISAAISGIVDGDSKSY